MSRPRPPIRTGKRSAQNSDGRGARKPHSGRRHFSPSNRSLRAARAAKGLGRSSSSCLGLQVGRDRGAGLARIVGQRQRQRLDRDQTEIDGRAQRLDLVVIVARSEHDLRRKRLALRKPGAGDRLVDAGGDRIERDDAGLHGRRAQLGLEPPARGAKRLERAGEAHLADRPARPSGGRRRRPRFLSALTSKANSVAPRSRLSSITRANSGFDGEWLTNSGMCLPACSRPGRAGPTRLNLDHARRRGARGFRRMCRGLEYPDESQAAAPRRSGRSGRHGDSGRMRADRPGPRLYPAARGRRPDQARSRHRRERRGEAGTAVEQRRAARQRLVLRPDDDPELHLQSAPA